MSTPPNMPSRRGAQLNIKYREKFTFTFTFTFTSKLWDKALKVGL
jgi:hypothetical protein